MRCRRRGGSPRAPPARSSPWSCRRRGSGGRYSFAVGRSIACASGDRVGRQRDRVRSHVRDEAVLVQALGAARMVRLASKRSLRLPSCWSVDVVNGGAGVRVNGFSSAERADLERSRSSSLRRAARPRPRRRAGATSSRLSLPVSGSKSLPPASRLPSSVTQARREGPCRPRRSGTSPPGPSTRRHEAHARALALHQHAYRHALHAAGGQARAILRQRIGETS